MTEPVEFDSPDGEAVDLVFGLMVPAELNDEHHADICGIADMLGDRELRRQLREANSSNELYETLCG